MPIKLLVTSVGDDGPPDEYVFDQSPVSIGRDGANLLTLPDPVRVVSKQHAEIRDIGTAFHLVDLGSKNYTYLNGTRLAAGEPVVLQPGDAFTIGDFELRFYPEAPAEPNYDQTVFAASFVNPFAEPAEQLAAVLGDLRRVFASESGSHRDEALRDALQAAMLGGGDEPGQIVAEALGGTPAATPPSPPPSYAPPPAPPAYTPPAPTAPPAQDMLDPDPPTAFERPVVPSEGFSSPPPPATPDPFPPVATPGAGAAPDGRTARIVDVLAESVARLTGIPRQFRREFIGQTMTHTQDMAFLYENSPSELKDLLLDPSADAQTLEQRLGAIRDATEEAVVHQLAMLDGYKASVQDGAQRLLGEVNPDPIEEEVEASNPMYKVPQLRAAAVIERLKETHRELGGEDWSVAERRAFRPAFIKAYLARMSRRRS